ncbi:unnamed protein product [Schistosoma mattheei]|uniref:Uncharacterized protein n=1 Tax=Schistosoma mattheei TaxID=31246 RepID=A0A183PAK8_9TREM|nr:unnamed protein product [Schistosoma mattheei]
MTWCRGMKESCKELACVGPSRLPGWGPRDGATQCFAFPRIFLSRAFWTPEQCKSIDTKCLKDRFDYNTQSLLKSKLLTIIYSSPCSMNYSQPILKSLRKLASALSQVSILEPISIEQIRDLVPAFKGPLSLEQLDTSHLVSYSVLCDNSIYSK